MYEKDQKGRIIYKWINRETRGSDSNEENLYTWSNERKIKQGGEFKVVKDVPKLFFNLSEHRQMRALNTKRWRIFIQTNKWRTKQGEDLKWWKMKIYGN